MDTNEVKETDDMNTSTPVLPVVANGNWGHNGHHNSGLEGKDAVMIHGFNSAQNQLALNETVSVNSKENVIKTLETGCGVERTVQSAQFALAEMIRTEASRTREFLQQQELARMVQAQTDGKFDILTTLIQKLIPTTPTK